MGDPPDRCGIGVRCKTVDLPHRVARSGAPSSFESEARSSSNCTLKRLCREQDTSISIAQPAKERKLARGQAQTTRLQRLGVCAEARPAEVAPTAAKAAPARPAVVDKHAFKQLVARVSGMRTSDSRCSHSSGSQGGTATKAKREVRASSRTSIIGEDGDSIEQASKKIRTEDAPHYPIHDIAVMHRLATSDSDDGQSNHGEGNAWWDEVEGMIETDRKADADWWDEVEGMIETDHKADADWWDEVESSIKADAISEASDNTNLGLNEAGGQRELLADRCERAAKRMKRPG